MHKSQLAGFIIDCQTDDLDRASQFWSQTLGYSVQPVNNPDDENYRILNTADDELHIEIQKVSHLSRVHLDIETDDIEAEVQRLEILGAKRVQPIQDWWVMEAPTGQRFCVIPAQGSNFSSQANCWD